MGTPRKGEPRPACGTPPHMGNVYGIPRPRGGVGHVNRAMIASSGPIRPPLSRGHDHFPFSPGAYAPRYIPIFYGAYTGRHTPILEKGETKMESRKEYNNGYCTKALRDKLRTLTDAAITNAMDGVSGAGDVFISYGNRKMGAIPSVSIPPYITCPAECRGTCDGKCYAGKLCGIYSSVATTYAKNLAIFRVNSAEYFRQISNVSRLYKWFRWHVSGDIVNALYFAGMVQVAKENPGTKYLAFTKRYNVVNEWVAENGELPENLVVLFSGWTNLKPDNPHNLPETNVFGNKEQKEPRPEWLICGGNCAECCCRGCGCWKAEKGETIAFKIH